MLENIVVNLYQKIQSHAVFSFSQNMECCEIKHEFNSKNRMTFRSYLLALCDSLLSTSFEKLILK